MSKYKIQLIGDLIDVVIECSWKIALFVACIKYIFN
jgi:hypothetical protein